MADAGLAGKSFVMLSNGGVTSASSASKIPYGSSNLGRLVGCWPAATQQERYRKTMSIAFDMGGTTAKICLLPAEATPYTGCIEIARTKRQFRGSGIPTMVPSIEMVEIGAGGGSIASIGSTGVLKVGPESAGAMPGPACYARGGIAATVTDADLVFGYIDPNSFLGGGMPLDNARQSDGAIATFGQQPGTFRGNAQRWACSRW